MAGIGIHSPKGKQVLLKKGGSTADIMEAVLDAIPGVKSQTSGFARQFTPDRAGMQKLWYWVRQNIQYKEDPFGVQWVREPARLFHDKVGDCKSFTVFIVSVLENMGLQYRVRFSNTETPGGKIVNHVYPIAVMPDGTDIIVDAVYSRFNAEKRFFYAKDYTMSDIYRLSGIGAVQVAEAEAYLQELEAATADISDDVLSDDITNMSAGQFAKYQAAQKFDAQADVAQTAAERAKYEAAAGAIRTGNISGIGAIAPGEAQKISAFLKETAIQTNKAFTAPVLVLPEGVQGIGRIAGIVDAIKNAWKKIINWIFKTAMPLAGPFFVYTFIKKVIGKKTKKKQDGQQRVLNWIQKAGKFDSESAVKEAAKLGIIKSTGKTPERLLNEAVKGQPIAGGIGSIVLLAAKAITFVIDIISKISKLFKKNQEPVDKADAADLGELATEAAAAQIAPGSSITTPSATTSSNGNLLPIALAAGVAILLLNKN